MASLFFKYLISIIFWTSFSSLVLHAQNHELSICDILTMKQSIQLENREIGDCFASARFDSLFSRIGINDSTTLIVEYCDSIQLLGVLHNLLKKVESEESNILPIIYSDKYDGLVVFNFSGNSNFNDCLYLEKTTILYFDANLNLKTMLYNYKGYPYAFFEFYRINDQNNEMEVSSRYIMPKSLIKLSALTIGELFDSFQNNMPIKAKLNWYPCPSICRNSIVGSLSPFCQ